jgi:hypothetical protein
MDEMDRLRRRYGSDCGRTARQPTFRSGVDLVTVDAAVLDGDGRPVRGSARRISGLTSTAALGGLFLHSLST